MVKRAIGRRIRDLGLAADVGDVFPPVNPSETFPAARGAVLRFPSRRRARRNCRRARRPLKRPRSRPVDAAASGPTSPLAALLEHGGPPEGDRTSRPSDALQRRLRPAAGPARRRARERDVEQRRRRPPFIKGVDVLDERPRARSRRIPPLTGRIGPLYGGFRPVYPTLSAISARPRGRDCSLSGPITGRP